MACRAIEPLWRRAISRTRGVCAPKAALSTGAVGSASVHVDAALARAEALSHLNAFVTLTHERARAAWARSQSRRAEGRSLGPVDGMLVAVKDNFCTLGTRTTCASRMLEDFVPPYDAAVVERLESAGGVVLGKTNMDEFGMGSYTMHSHFGPCLNPWQPRGESGRCVSGGSSGGSAVAVAAGICDGALGSDTGGSVRLPASYCGVVGVKPSYGRASRHGLVAYASSLDVPGVMARTVRDAAVLLGAVAGFDRRDSTSVDVPVSSYVDCASIEEPLAGLRIGVPKEYRIAAPKTHEAWDAAVTWLRAKGAHVAEVSLPTTAAALSAYYVIASGEASSNLSRYDGVEYGRRATDPVNVDDMFTRSRTEGLGAEVRRRILLGTFVLSRKAYESYYVKAQRVRRLVRDEFLALLGDADSASAPFDALLAPTAPTSAPTLAAAREGDVRAEYANDVMTVPASLAGIPAASVPFGVDSRGMPIGLQVIAGYLREDRLFRVAAAVERAAGECGRWTKGRTAPL